MEKKIIEWFLIENQLGKVKSYPGFAFQMWCLINEKKISEALTIIREKSNPSEEFKAFQQKAEKIKQDLCVKNKEGEPLITNNLYEFTDENKKELEERIKELEAEYDETIKEHVEKLNKYYEYIQNDTLSIDVKMLDQNKIPEKYFEEHPDQSGEFIQICLDLINHD